MNDRELLELAAKSIEYRIKREASEHCLIVWNKEDDCFCWNPLTDDGDALRLAVMLGISVDRSQGRCWAWANGWTYPGVVEESNNNDPYAATRRAIVRAAAEIGRSI